MEFHHCVSRVMGTVVVALGLAAVSLPALGTPAEQSHEVNRMNVEHLALGITFDFRLNRISDENAVFLRYEFVGTGRDTADPSADFTVNVSFRFLEPPAGIATSHKGGGIFTQRERESQKEWLVRTDETPTPGTLQYSIIDQRPRRLCYVRQRPSRGC